MPLPPEAKAQLAEQKKQCIFCKIISKEIQTHIVFEDKKSIALMDIYPAVKGHTIFLPKEHYPLLPYYEPDEIKPFFGLLPQVVKSIKGAMVSTGVDIFIASGGAAGQQSPHFACHVLPRESGDGFLNFLFNRKFGSLSTQHQQLFLTTFPKAIAGFLPQQNLPALSKGGMPTHLEGIAKNSLVLYEDEQLLVVAPSRSAAEGHLEIYSKLEAKFIEKLTPEQSIRFFSISSLCSNVVFSIMQPQATNFILKSGNSDDNKDGLLCMHIIARKQGDHLQGLLWQPQQPKYDIGGVAAKMKDRMWDVKYVEPKVDVKKEVVEKKVEKNGSLKEQVENTRSKNEIDEAIQRLWGK